MKHQLIGSIIPHLRPDLKRDVDYLCIDRADGIGPRCEWLHTSDPPTIAEILQAAEEVQLELDTQIARKAAQQIARQTARQNLRNALEKWDTLSDTQKLDTLKTVMEVLVDA